MFRLLIKNCKKLSLACLVSSWEFNALFCPVMDKQRLAESFSSVIWVSSHLLCWIRTHALSVRRVWHLRVKGYFPCWPAIILRHCSLCGMKERLEVMLMVEWKPGSDFCFSAALISETEHVSEPVLTRDSAIWVEWKSVLVQHWGCDFRSGIQEQSSAVPPFADAAGENADVFNVPDNQNTARQVGDKSRVDALLCDIVIYTLLRHRRKMPFTWVVHSLELKPCLPRIQCVVFCFEPIIDAFANQLELFLYSHGSSEQNPPLNKI